MRDTKVILAADRSNFPPGQEFDGSLNVITKFAIRPLHMYKVFPKGIPNNTIDVFPNILLRSFINFKLADPKAFVIKNTDYIDSNGE